MIGWKIHRFSPDIFSLFFFLKFFYFPPSFFSHNRKSEQRRGMKEKKKKKKSTSPSRENARFSKRLVLLWQPLFCKTPKVTNAIISF